MAKWETEEAEMSAKLMLHCDYPVLLCHLIYLVRPIAVHGLLSSSTAGLLAIFNTIRLFFHGPRRIENTKVKFWFVFFLYEVGQVSSVQQCT